MSWLNNLVKRKVVYILWRRYCSVIKLSAICLAEGNGYVVVLGIHVFVFRTSLSLLPPNSQM